MEIEKIGWQEEYKTDPGVTAFRAEPPAIGIEVLFIETWKPCMVVHLWRWRLQAGWIAE